VLYPLAQAGRAGVLRALAGVAEAVQVLSNMPKEDYLAGLWRRDLGKDLFWQLVGTGTRLQGYRAPSWSWASVEGAANWNPSGARSSDCRLAIKILDTQINAGDVGPFGLLKGGILKVAAPTFQVSLHEPNLTTQNYLG
jgi:hypothetical protein